ncbi:MAG: hypothetical protein QOG32_159 [Chloroflexota bacterium]|nr:hypothetical protein [Chloroflexota bacterium]
MAINLLRRRSRRPKLRLDYRRGFAIGEADAHVFNCPACSRPLSEGTARCPGCGVRLVMGVTLRRAGSILALGIVIGFLLGGGSTAAAISLSLRDSKPNTAGLVASPSASPSPTPLPSRAPESTIPGSQAAVSALSGTAVVNGRIAVDAVTLKTTLRDSHASATDLARALRSLAADAALGIDLTDRLAPWRDAAVVTTELETFYRKMADSATTSLRLSLDDTAGYRRAGAQMLTVLGGLRAVDAASRVLAATLNLDLAPVAVP